MSNGGDGADEVYTVDLGRSPEDGRSIPVLLSEEMLAQLLKASEEEQHDVENDDEGSDKDDIGKVEDTDEESVVITLESKHNGEEDDVGSSTDSEIPVGLDYGADSESREPRNIKLEENKPLTILFEEEENVDNELPTVMEDYDTQTNQDYNDPKDGHQEQTFDYAISTANLQDEQILPDPETDKSNTNKDKESIELAEKKLSEEKEGEKDTNRRVGHAKGKRLRKVQHDQGLSTEVISEHLINQEPEKEPETSPSMEQRKGGEWVRWMIIKYLEAKISNATDLFVNSMLKKRTKIL